MKGDLSRTTQENKEIRKKKKKDQNRKTRKSRKKGKMKEKGRKFAVLDKVLYHVLLEYTIEKKTISSVIS